MPTHRMPAFRRCRGTHQRIGTNRMFTVDGRRCARAAASTTKVVGCAGLAEHKLRLKEPCDLRHQGLKASVAVRFVAVSHGSDHLGVL